MYFHLCMSFNDWLYWPKNSIWNAFMYHLILFCLHFYLSFACRCCFLILTSIFLASLIYNIFSSNFTFLYKLACPFCCCYIFHEDRNFYSIFFLFGFHCFSFEIMNNVLLLQFLYTPNYFSTFFSALVTIGFHIYYLPIFITNVQTFLFSVFFLILKLSFTFLSYLGM